MGLSPLESMPMNSYLIYKYNINHMGYQRNPKIALNSNQNHLHLKQGWHKYARVWLNHWGIVENATFQNIDNIQSLIAYMFKEKMWC